MRSTSLQNLGPTSGRPIPKLTPELARRFWAKVEKTDTCWNWTASHNPGGYGQFAAFRDVWASHRIAYSECVGPVPEGLTLDHLCCNKNCVNPAHLEPVTAQENLRRGRVQHGLKTHCKNGHPFDATNTYIRPDNGRQCRKCRQAAQRRHYARSTTVALASCLAALGLAAGLFAFPAHADNPAGATSLADLQALGYGLGHVADLPLHPTCFYWVVMYGNGAPWTVLGEPDQTTGVCATDPALVQQRIDALVAAYPPPPPTPPTTTTVAPVLTTTTAPTVTTDTVTTTPLPTTTAVVDTAPATTTTAAVDTTATVAAPVTTTVAAPDAPAPAPVTQTVTVTTTVIQADPTVDARLSALEQTQATDEARITTLEANVGMILGEPKNTAPFTNTV